jgi:radical SAM superfamily enzyme YgiQ (UPF0313 family)
MHNVVEAATPEYVSENSGCLPPMGLLYLQGALERSNHESIFLDANAERWDYATTVRNVLRQSPDLVGLQAMTFTMPDAYRMAVHLKEVAPELPIMIGGPHPTLFPLETVSLPAVDFAFAGEGEVDLIHFLDCFEDEQARASIPGVACKQDGQPSFTPSRGLLPDLDQLAFPARHSSRLDLYHSVLAKRNPITVMITSRGCPFNCVFCNRMGRKYRWHSAEYVLREFEEIASLGIGEVFIHDDTFTLRRDRVEAICSGLIKRDLGLIWEARTRVDCVDQELLELMANAGCRRLSFGVESASPKVLDSMRKGIDLDRVRSVFGWAKEVGITTLADFMVGSLDEELDDVKTTFSFAKTIRPDYVQYSICSPYPGTPLYEIGRETGLIPEDIWLEFAKNPLADFKAPVWTQHFSEQELVELAAEGYRRFYLRPTRILRELATVRSWRTFRKLFSAGWGVLCSRFSKKKCRKA